MPLIGRWKMLDNLRRSLSAPASLAALVAGWTLPTARRDRVDRLHPAGAGAAARCCRLFAAILPRRSTVTLRSHLRALRLDFALALAQTALLTSMLAYQAWLMCDAIGRTLWRMFVSHRHLLEWITAPTCSVERALRPRRASTGAWRAAWCSRSCWRRSSSRSPAERRLAIALPFVLAVARGAGRRLAHQPHAARGREIRAVATSDSASCA